MVAGHIGDKPTYISAHSRWQGMLTFGKECSLLFSIARWYKLPSSAHCGCDSQSQFFLRPKKSHPRRRPSTHLETGQPRAFHYPLPGRITCRTIWARSATRWCSATPRTWEECVGHDVVIDKSIMSILEGYIYILYLSTICIRYSCTHVVCVHLQVANADIYKLQTKGYETWSKNIGGQQSAKLSTIVSKSLRAIVPCINEVLPGYKSVAKSDDHLPKFGN